MSPVSTQPSIISTSSHRSSSSIVNMDPFDDEWSNLLPGSDFIDTSNMITPPTPVPMYNDDSRRHLLDILPYSSKYPKYIDGLETIENFESDYMLSNGQSNIRRHIDIPTSQAMSLMNQWPSINSAPLNSLPSNRHFSSMHESQRVQYPFLNSNNVQKIDGSHIPKSNEINFCKFDNVTKSKNDYVYPDNNSSEPFNQLADIYTMNVRNKTKSNKNYNVKLSRRNSQDEQGENFDQNSSDQVSDSSSSQGDSETKSLKRSKLSSSSELTNYSEYGYWTVLNQDNNYVNLENQPSMDKVYITIKTRTDPEDTRLLCKMYSSLRYTMIVKLHSSIFSNDALNFQGEFKTDCEIVYAESIDRLAKNSRTGQCLVHMEHHAPLLQKRSEWLETKEKLSFSDVSYHHKNSAFRLKLNITHTGFSPQKPILTIISSPFMLFARRPKTEVHARKRKYDSERNSEDIVERPLKKQKMDDHPITFTSFQISENEYKNENSMIEQSQSNTNDKEENTNDSEISLAFGLIQKLQNLKQEIPLDKWSLVEKKLIRTFLKPN